MSGLDDYADILNEIREHWNIAERDIKQAEQISEKVVIPAVLELRYAGRRLIDALHLIATSGDKQEIENMLRDARFDCHRARHDALDAATSKMALVTSAYVSKLGHNAILAAFHDFPQFMHDLKEVRDKIVQSREAREDRNAIYTTISEANFPVLANLYTRMLAAEPVMRAMAKRDRRSTAVSYIGIGVGIIGTILTAIGLFLFLAK